MKAPAAVKPGDGSEKSPPGGVLSDEIVRFPRRAEIRAFPTSPQLWLGVERPFPASQPVTSDLLTCYGRLQRLAWKRGLLLRHHRGDAALRMPPLYLHAGGRRWAPLWFQMENWSLITQKKWKLEAALLAAVLNNVMNHLAFPLCGTIISVC